MTEKPSQITMECVLAKAGPIANPQSKPGQTQPSLLATEFLTKDQFYHHEPYLFSMGHVFLQRLADGAFRRIRSLLKALEGAHFVVIGKSDQGQAIGFCLLTTQGDAWHLDYVMTDRDFAGRQNGHAVQMRVRAEAIIAHPVIKKLRLECLPDREGFYSKFGFTKIE